jgi:putative ABC transport system permease protein
MVKRTLNKKMWRDLWLLKAQTTTTAILIVCGVSLLVSEWSAYRSLQRARDSYYKEYDFADLFAEFKRASIEPINQITKIPGVEAVVPRVSSEGLVNIPGKSDPAVGRFISVPSGLQPALNHLHLRKGRLPIDSTEVEIVVHEGFAVANGLEPGDKFGLIVQGQSEQARVVGIGLSPEYVYALSPSAPLPDDLHFGVFWMTEKTLQRLLKMSGGYNSITAKIDQSTEMQDVITAVDRILKPYGSLGAYGRDRQISNMFVEDEISQQRVSSIFIPAIFLAIATFLINIITSRLVALHRAQIASLKAMGYTRTEVSAHYLKLIFIMTLVGAIPGIGIGALLGRWMSSTYESYFRFPSLHFSTSVAASLIGLAAGILPGLIGATASIRSVFKMAPAEAMRPMSPPAFHATLVEKLRLPTILSPTGLMAFRNLLQRPMRLGLVILSLSAALAIVVAAGSWSDMIDFLLKTQFQRMQKEDLSLSLTRPRSTSVLQELSRMPGVISVEGFRAVPTRIRYLNHKREIQLTGWPEKIEMRELLNRELKPIELPPTGILLSRFFEKNWEMKRGDLIQLEPLEGTNRILTLPVAGFSDELIGISANMKIQELWKLMGEDPGYNMIALKADPRKLNELYVRLKGSPEVGAVNLKNALYKGFSESFGQVIRTATLVLMIASLLIALGIIYNSVRVSFSERSWELASLRVLGFEQSEVTWILLLEVGTQVLLSLIPGCFLGLWLTHLSMRLIHTETFAFPVVVEAATYARGLLAVLLAFVASSIVVFRMTGRLNPAEALKARE